MNDALAHGPEADDRPASVPATVSAPAAAPRVVVVRAGPGMGLRMLRLWFLLSLLLAVGLGVCVAAGLHQIDFSPMHLYIDGEDLGNIDFSGLGDGGRVLLLCGGILLVLLMLMLVPLILFLALGGVVLGLVCAVVVPLAIVAIALAAATSPFWLVGLLVWLIVRRRPAPSATIAA